MARRLVFLFPLFLCLGMETCENEYPGETDGTFHVIGFLESNTCGSGVGAVNPLEFYVEVRSDEDGQAVWRIPQQPMATGVRNGDDYRFDFYRTAAVYGPDPTTGTAGCALDEHDMVYVTIKDQATDGGVDGGVVDAGAANDDLDGGSSTEEALTGTNVIELTPAPGSDCTFATTGPTGVFAALPCRVEYRLRGTPHHAL